jgi:hypothetical protein
MGGEPCFGAAGGAGCPNLTKSHLALRSRAVTHTGTSQFPSPNPVFRPEKEVHARLGPAKGAGRDVKETTMTTSSVCRALAAAIAVPAILIAAPAIAMATGTSASHTATVHQVTVHQTITKPVTHVLRTAASSTEPTVAQSKHPTTRAVTTSATPVRHHVARSTSPAAPQPKPVNRAAPVVADTAGTPRGAYPCDGDAYACFHWHAAYHWDGEYHVLGYHVEAGHYWNAGAYGDMSPTHASHGHYWNAGSHVNVVQDYNTWHHED